MGFQSELLRRSAGRRDHGVTFGRADPTRAAGTRGIPQARQTPLVRLGLEPLPLEVATGFLLERTGQDDAAAARAIAGAVGGLPLALEQAAAYLIENPWRSLANYARLLRTRMAEMLRQGKPDDYPLPVASTWDLSFQRIEQEQPAAADLLRLCAFLAPDDIPIKVLQTVASELSDQPRRLPTSSTSSVVLAAPAGSPRPPSLPCSPAGRTSTLVRMGRCNPSLAARAVRKEILTDLGRQPVAGVRYLRY